MRAILALTFLLLGASSPLFAQFDFGCTNPSACNYDPEADIDNGTCIYWVVGDLIVDEGPVNGPPPFSTTQPIFWEFINSNGLVLYSGQGDESTTIFSGCGCYAMRLTAATNQDWAAGWLTPDTAFWHFDSAQFPNSTGTLLEVSEQVQVVVNSTESPCYPGCKDPAACNFNSSATFDDIFLCEYGGCTDPGACNFDSEVTCDDGSCVYDTSCIDNGCRNATGQEIGFDGEYDGWSLQTDGGNGDVELSDHRITLYSSNNYYTGEVDTYVSSDVSAGSFTFDWDWYSVDINASTELPYYAVNGVKTYLNPPGSYDGSGTITLTFNSADELVFGIESDNINGRSVLNISNVRYDGQICGCDDPWACNYDSAAAFDDGSCCYSCIYLAVEGGSADSEISWDVVDSEGEVVLSGGAQPSTFYCNIDATSGCYWIKMLDAGGDGWNGATWQYSDAEGNSLSGTLEEGSEGVMYFAEIGSTSSGECEPTAECIIEHACNYTNTSYLLDISTCEFPECNDVNAANYVGGACPGECVYQVNSCGLVVNGEGDFMGLEGNWAPDQWQLQLLGASSYLADENAQGYISPSQMILASKNSYAPPQNDDPAEVQYFLIAPETFTFSFDYEYTTRDPQYGGYSQPFVNHGGRTNFSYDVQGGSGSMEVTVNQGDTLGFGMTTLYTAYGADVLRISNFRYDAGKCACMDDKAVNFDPFATSDNGNCMFTNECDGLSNENDLVAGFTDLYSKSQWNTSPVGVGQIAIGEYQLFLQGNEDGTAGESTYAYINVPQDGMLRFEWEYNNPSGPPSEDLPYFILGNGDSALISDEDLLHSGTKEVNVSAGDLFGFSVKSDGGANPATLLITNLVHNSVPCVPGCVYEQALNFDSTATVDDGSCLYPDATCPSDLNGDSSINTGDLLLMLADFGTECD